LKGILLGSEYPAPPYRSVIEKAFPVPTISWYGHSEMTVLAGENGTPLVYEPFHSYGFCEAVPSPDGQMHLVGTCYDNFASPFIRYDTGDSIAPEQVENGLLASFRIQNGRLGEFVLDQTGHPVSLTALIFGRHHKAFESAEFIQISQDRPGHAILHVTTRTLGTADQMMKRFDLGNINMTFDIECREQPVRTERGKIPLLITEKQLKASGCTGGK
jgi:phenylacetate-CoA ligase